jgi:membrane protein DedA with SNARE-associated domain
MSGPMASAAGMRFRSLLGCDHLDAFIWSSVVITIGYFVGNQLNRVAHLVHEGSEWIAAITFLVMAAIWLLWRYGQHRSGGSEA